MAARAAMGSCTIPDLCLVTPGTRVNTVGLQRSGREISTMDRINQKFRLRDGRTLGFAEYGSAGGMPVVYFHGWPSSRLEPAAVAEVCTELQVRLIAPDRPGLGLSDFQRGRTILDFVK